jgi:hypothetical protein
MNKITCRWQYAIWIALKSFCGYETWSLTLWKADPQKLQISEEQGAQIIHIEPTHSVEHAERINPQTRNTYAILYDCN